MSVNARRFEKAATDFVADPGNTESISTMMQLAMEGVNPTRRRWAARWLHQHCNVVVVPEGVNDAAEAAATGLR
jgi:hypothetical protein